MAQKNYGTCVRHMAPPPPRWWDAPLPDCEAFGHLCTAVARGAVAAGESGTTGGGRGLFATSGVKKGDVIFVESPALLLQDPCNRAGVRACAFCHAFLRRGADECECAQGCGEGYCDTRCRDRHMARGHRVLCVGPLDSWEHPLAALKLAAARDEQGDGNLALLTEMCGRCFAAPAAPPAPDVSTSGGDGDNPAPDAAAAAGGGGGTAVDHAAAHSATTTTTTKTSFETSPLAAASLHWFVRGAWWDHGAGLSGGNERRSALEPLCEKYAALLAPAMRAAAEARTCDPEAAAALLPSGGDGGGGLVSARGVAELAGLLVRNQLSVVVESPQVRLARELLRRERHRRSMPARSNHPNAGRDGGGAGDDDKDENENEDDRLKEDASALEAELVASGALLPRQPLEGAAADVTSSVPNPSSSSSSLPPDSPPPSVLLAAAQAAFPSFDGAGLFPLVCLMNHSCEPNVEVWFDDGGRGVGAVCRVVAMKNIALGDELRHSYIDPDRPAQLRAVGLNTSVPRHDS